MRIILFSGRELLYDGATTARGFGMRVVGGKTGADGRLFAYLVWTVPGGPAEKMGLQQGDKVRNFLHSIHSHFQTFQPLS